MDRIFRFLMSAGVLASGLRLEETPPNVSHVQATLVFLLSVHVLAISILWRQIYEPWGALIIAASLPVSVWVVGGRFVVVIAKP